uniref:BRCT domain-containing protein n=2 Tax=Mucochytrium quahogii TaxID=96639 RepID=A0A7S2WB28_9STRA|mmetsp:Transcript_18931/g.41069  ORF Transcript_18931/g.41069 Transcript_18931/m.41069 type:complete len:531 (+) Transcript_18931:1563-3155(+)
MNQVESAVKVSASSAQPDSSLSTPDIHGEKASGIPIEETQTTEDESTGTRTASESREEKAVNVDPVIKDTKAKSRHEGELQTINQAVGNGDTYEGPERVAPFFVVGNTVTVSRRMYPGSNKPGGAAKITKVNDDDTYDVRYIVARNTEKRVPGKEITAGININSSSFFGNGLHQEEEDSPLLTSHGRPERQNTTRLLFDPSLYHHSMDPFSQTTAKKKREGEVKVLNKKRHKSLPGNFSTSTDTRETPPEAKSPKKRKSLSSFHDSDMTNSNSGALVRSGSRNSKRKKRICPVASGFSTGPPPVILLTGSLGKSSSKDRAIDQILAMSGKYMPELDDTVTHVVVQHDRKIKGRLVARNRTYKYICAIAKGLWVLDVKWIRDSAHAGRWLDEAKYEIDGDLITKDFNTGGPKRSRERLVNQDVPLLRNFVIYICGSFPQTNLQKANYRLIIEMCGGMALTSSNADCMKKLESTKEKAYILCQNIEYATLDKNYSKIQQLVEQGGAHFVNGQWLINSVSTYTLQKENKYYPS